MIGIMVIFIIPLIISLFLAVKTDNSIEKFFPVSASGIVLILFISGFFGKLKIGLFIIYGVTVVLLVAVFLIEHKIKKLISKLLTPAVLVYCLLFAISIHVSYGVLANNWDEFSHWMDIVKVYCIYGRLGDASTQNVFSSYIPGLPLYEYLCAGTNYVIKKEFIEWAVYVSYQMLMVQMVMPFISIKERRRWYAAIPVAIILFLYPTFCFSVYTGVLIDPILSIITGAGIAFVFTSEKKDWTYDVTVLSYAFLLITAKTSGCLFGVLLLVYYVIDSLFEKKRKHTLIISVLSVLTVLLPNLLWNYHIKHGNIGVVFAEKVNLRELAKIMFHRDTSYRNDVYLSFAASMKCAVLRIGNTGISISFQMFIFYAIVVAIVLNVFVWNNKSKRKNILLGVMLLLIEAIYIFGTVVAYMFKFSESEALSLASFYRYIYVGLFIEFAVIIFIAVYYTTEKNRIIRLLILLAITAFVVPFDTAKKAVARTYIHETVESRATYDVLNNKIMMLVDSGIIKPNDKMYFLSQGSGGLEYFVENYLARPVEFQTPYSWSICTENPGTFDRQMSVADFRRELINGYKYLAIYKTDDRLNDYISLFEDGIIEDNSIYELDLDTGMLKKVK